jgi:hypothetical protein
MRHENSMLRARLSEVGIILPQTKDEVPSAGVPKTQSHEVSAEGVVEDVRFSENPWMEEGGLQQSSLESETKVASEESGPLQDTGQHSKVILNAREVPTEVSARLLPSSPEAQSRPQTSQQHTAQPFDPFSSKVYEPRVSTPVAVGDVPTEDWSIENLDRMHLEPPSERPSLSDLHSASPSTTKSLELSPRPRTSLEGGTTAIDVEEELPMLLASGAASPELTPDGDPFVMDERLDLPDLAVADAAVDGSVQQEATPAAGTPDVDRALEAFLAQHNWQHLDVQMRTTGVWSISGTVFQVRVETGPQASGASFQLMSSDDNGRTWETLEGAIRRRKLQKVVRTAPIAMTLNPEAVNQSQIRIADMEHGDFGSRPDYNTPRDFGATVRSVRPSQQSPLSLADLANMPRDGRAAFQAEPPPQRVVPTFGFAYRQPFQASLLHNRR